MNPVAASEAEIAAVISRATREPVWIRVGRFFDGEEHAREVDLVFDAAAIRHIGNAPHRSVIRAAQTGPDLVLPSHTVLPGLVEAHGHMFLEGGEENPERRADYLKLPESELLQRAEARLGRLVRMGVLAVRDAGDRNGVGLELQRRGAAALRGNRPLVESPGAAIHHQGRYGAFMGRALENDGSIEAAVSARVAEGAAHIKLLATGIINFEKGAVTTKPQMPVDELARAVGAARYRKRQTMVHCSGNDGVSNCIEAGVDTIEHGFFIDRGQMEKMCELDIAWVPTFAPVHYQLEAADRLGWNANVRDNLRRILDAHAESLAFAAGIGARIVAGSDAGSHGVPHGHGLFKELELMESAGMSTLQVLRAATGAPASRLGMSESIGRIEVGRRARFILSAAPVLDGVRHLRAPALVFVDGTVHRGGDDPASRGM